MANTMKQDKKGYFEIARESADISFEHFCRHYFDTERPVIIEGIASQWNATNVWTEDYIREKLADEPSAKAASLWYWMERDTLNQDYTMPEIIERLIDSPQIIPRDTLLMRLWVHFKGNVSSWHYDANLVNVFNIQITGLKEWIIISPDTPLASYPFLSFAVMGETDEKILKNKRYAKFDLKQGDMLYLPPLWYHKVVSKEEENISVNWIFTKKKTKVLSKTLIRELERYHLQDYLSNHRYEFVRNTFNSINKNMPAYLRWKWRYPEMIETPHIPRKFQLIRRTFNEMAVIGKVIRYSNKIRPYIDNLKPIKKLR